MQHFDKTVKPTATGKPIPAAMSHNDLLTLLQCSPRLVTSLPPSPPPPTATTTPLLQQLPTTILRHSYHNDDDDIDIEAIIAETSFMEPNIATTKVYSDHEINYYSNRYHETNDTPTTTTTQPIATTAIDNKNSSTLKTIQPLTANATIDSIECGFKEPLREQINGTAADQHKQEQHLYHTL